MPRAYYVIGRRRWSATSFSAQQQWSTQVTRYCPRNRSRLAEGEARMTETPTQSGQRSDLRRYTACGELRIEDVGSRVTIKGWVNRRRDHGGLIFLDVRDRYGITQVVANPEESPAAHAVAEGIRSEYVVSITGTVMQRPEGTANPQMATGDIEVHADEIEVLNPA